MLILTMLAAASLGIVSLVQPAFSSEPSSDAAPAIELNDEVRASLIAARESAWRAFFSEDPERLKDLLGPELIAIQQSQDAWERRDNLVELAEQIQKQKVEIRRLEFPHTEIQIYENVAILYYAYIFETGLGDRSVTDAGRGTEIFVRRDGRWVDVGWHLDHGAFKRGNGVWNRVSPDVPERTSP